MKSILKFLPYVVFLILAIGCSKDEEDSPTGLDARLQGTWASIETTMQYLDASGNVTEETPHPEGEMGELTLNKGVFTLLEDGDPYSGTYQTNQSSGKDFLILTADGTSTTIEIQFPSSNQLVLIWGQGSIVGGGSAKVYYRNHALMVKR